jgi:hypothetical protein
VIEAIAEFGDVLMQMAKGNFVILPDDAALEQSPEGFNCVGVDFTVRIADLVIDGLMFHESADFDVARPFIRNQDGISARDVFAYQFRHALASKFGLVYWSGDDAATAFNHADYGDFLGSASTFQWWLEFAALVALARLTWPDIGFVHFHDALKQFALLEHGIADSHSHVPARVFVDLKITGELASGDALFGVQYKRNGKEPFLQGQMGVMENRAYGDAESGIAGIAVMAALGRHRTGFVCVAVWANRSAIPADALNVGYAIGFGGKQLVNFDNVHGYPFAKTPKE